MNFFRKGTFLCAIVCSLHANNSTAQLKSINPVTKNASPEAKALLNFFYSISGQYILSGQHNYPNVKDRNTQFATQYISKTPVIFSTDWGFERDGNSDSYLARPDIVKEAIRQHQLGAIVTICWHAVPPTADEPVTFQPRPGADSAKLASVQGRLLDQQFRDVLTPGTSLYKQWARQVDSVAVYLKKLQDAHVPVLWRPYHEMNGDWFWWGGRQGEYSTIKLYRQIFDRLVNYHKLNNLVWIWSIDRPSKPERQFSNFYPGNEFLDILAIDIYGNDFNQDYYDSLVALSKGKPVVLGEVGNPPSTEILKLQPKWAYYVVWAGMVRNTSKKQYDALTNDSRVLFLQDAAYSNAIASYRKAASLSPLTFSKNTSLNFSGQWLFSEEMSKLDNMGTGNQPARLEINQDENGMDIKRTMISEYSDNTIMEQQLVLDGKERESKAPFGNAPMLVKAWSAEKSDTIFIETKMTFGQRDFVTNEVWTLQDSGSKLSITQSSSTFSGDKRQLTLVFQKL